MADRDDVLKRLMQMPPAKRPSSSTRPKPLPDKPTKGGARKRPTRTPRSDESRDK